MALTPSKVLRYPAALDQTANSNPQAILYSIPNSPRSSSFRSGSQGVSLRNSSNECYKEARTSDSRLWGSCRRPLNNDATSRRLLVHCHSNRTPQTKSRDDISHAHECADITGEGTEAKEVKKTAGRQDLAVQTPGLAQAYRYAHNDAKFVNERARKDIVILSRGLRSLDARARQDVAIIGSGFLKLDARAREDTGKIDDDVKRKAERLQHIATIIKDKAKSRLKTAADQHWSDGALEVIRPIGDRLKAIKVQGTLADLRRADLRAKRRAMEDTLMALEFVKNIHDIMVNKIPLRRNYGSVSENIMLEKNGKALDFFPGDVSSDRITAIEEAYWSMASALSEADGIDYTNPEELELLITTLIDLDAMDGKSSVSLLAEASSSPDVSTRQALANALAAAPSMWTLGNAGMGALQRLAEDSDPAVAAAASRAIYELKQQWDIEEGDSWRFTLNQTGAVKEDGVEEDDDETS